MDQAADGLSGRNDGSSPRGTGPSDARLAGSGDAVTNICMRTLGFAVLEQLLYGLTDGYANLGDAAKAQVYYQRMTTDAAGSPLIARAKARAAGEAVAGQAPCQQCHGR
jgi:hypothetical protein